MRHRNNRHQKHSQFQVDEKRSFHGAGIFLGNPTMKVKQTLGNLNNITI
jgi:hypothetical protein